MRTKATLEFKKFESVRIFVFSLYTHLLSYIGQERNIWIIGSSIIKWAFQRACLSEEKAHLGLQRQNYRILWQGKGGLTLNKLFPRIQLLLRYEPSPDILIIHCGGNDIGNVPLLDLRTKMKEIFQRIQTRLPNTILGWSHILPRSSWRYSNNVKSQNFAAKRQLYEQIVCTK